MAVIVEVLNKQQKVTERHKFLQHQVRVGRAFDNDVILFNKPIPQRLGLTLLSPVPDSKGRIKRLLFDPL